MSKDPTPRADALRAQREERYGYLQATAPPAKPRKLIPYAGKPHGEREDMYGKKTFGGRPPKEPAPTTGPDGRPIVKRKRAVRKRKTS